MSRKKIRKTYELGIDSLSHEGRGVGRFDGKTVFVGGALPGETVLAERYRRRSRFDEALALEIANPSPDRVAPPCEFDQVCGGCSLQHLDTAAQIAHKESVVLELISHAGGIEPDEILPPLTGPTEGYRRKARLGVKNVPKKGRVLVGFRERNTPFIADIAYCRVLDPRLGHLLRPLSALIGSLSIPDRIPQVEVAAGDDAIALVFRHLEPFTAADTMALGRFGSEHGVFVYTQSGGEETVAALAEPADLRYTVDEDITLSFMPTDFTQVNVEINRLMIRRAIELMEIEADDIISDLFCGLGNFSLPLARRATAVFGFEGERGLVERARMNAKANQIGNAVFDVADLSDPDWYRTGLAVAAAESGDTVNKVLLDPPRTGAQALFEAGDLAAVERIVYVSCNPATLARDIESAVSRHGFRLASAGVMDMFPHTAHVESIAVLSR